MREGWPGQMTCQEMADDLRKRFDTSLTSHFHVFDFKKRLNEKAKSGQIVRFTDVFGMAIGDALLPVGYYDNKSSTTEVVGGVSN